MPYEIKRRDGTVHVEQLLINALDDVAGGSGEPVRVCYANPDRCMLAYMWRAETPTVYDWLATHVGNYYEEHFADDTTVRVTRVY